ncbi:glycosyltransferase [Pseudalkalibacillus caeni]|uniref:Glycosyltransferase n=1 Tax=Exobacillus caeni TaxID=2574798 RepID=A0A5R9F041_9BACL|nr:glycosyltransferase [Pseudalkalibacillus caeni]TLS35770.1 glycosyltransferase [Pseudalkalibacillus caeni]
MKKNLLFVMPGLSAGGGEKSLVSLLAQIDFKKYNVDLFLFNHEGIFMEYLPKEVNLLSLPESYELFSAPLLQSVNKLLLNGKPLLAINRLRYFLANRIKENISEREQISWKYLSSSLENINKKYDMAIGFLEKSSTYFCVDHVNATKKIGWVHIDYDNLGMNPEFDLIYFEKLNNIITVSEECASILKKRFPTQKEKVEVIYNIVSPIMINKMAQEKDEDLYNRKKDETVILSIGRLHYQKGYELAIEACKILINKGYNIKWNVIGEGEERNKLSKLIKENKLDDHFRLLGLNPNPYPYIQQADIYAQTSRFEGKSIAIDEAKILNKPIVVTNFSTAKDQIEDGKNGLIVNMDPNGIAEGIERLINNVTLKQNLIQNLSSLKLGTEDEIKKLYKICD